MSGSTARGWAVVDDGLIDVRTVSLTRRAAIVNWLVTHGVVIGSTYSDEQIEALWFVHKVEAECKEVEIETCQ